MVDFGYEGLFPMNEPNPFAVPIVVSLDEIYNMNDDVDYNEEADFNDDIENLSETYNFLNAYYHANNFFVLCKACRKAIRSKEIKAHLKKEHGWKVLHTQNWKNTQRNHEPYLHPPFSIQPVRDIDYRDRRNPGISTQTNSSNYNMKFSKEVTDVKGRIKKRKLFAQLRRRLM